MRITELGMMLQELRSEKKMTQATLAENMELTTPYVSNMEQGIYVPNKDVLNRIAKCFELNAQRKAELMEAADLSRLTFKMPDFQTYPMGVKRAVILLAEHGNKLSDKKAEAILHVVEEVLGKK